MKLSLKWLLLFLFLPVVFLGCSQSASESTENSSPQTADEFSLAKQVILDYWEAMNQFDAELALSYCEPAYREERRERVYDQVSRMQPLKYMNYKLTITEMSEPVYIEEGKLEIRATLLTPIGNKYLLYNLVKVDGEWKICLSYELTTTGN